MNAMTKQKKSKNISRKWHPNLSQRNILSSLHATMQLYWYWQNLWVFIDTEASLGQFHRFRGSRSHFDPDKARETQFGKFLAKLREQFQKNKDKELKVFEKLESVALTTGIPQQAISSVEIAAGKTAWVKPSMERLLLYVSQTKSRFIAERELRESVQNAVSQREADITAKYLLELRKKPLPAYQPSEHTKQWAAMRRHWGRMHK